MTSMTINTNHWRYWAMDVSVEFLRLKIFAQLIPACRIFLFLFRIACFFKFPNFYVLVMLSKN